MSSVDKFKAFYEKMTFKVEVEGLPAMYIDGNSPGQVKNHLRKLVKQPSLIKSVTRQTKTDVKKVYRDKAQGKEEVAEGKRREIFQKKFSSLARDMKKSNDALKKINTDYNKKYGIKKDALDYGTDASVKLMKKQTPGQMLDERGADSKGHFRATDKGAGMTAKGVAAHRRENPGSKLQTAVTGKVKPGSKAAGRRKSFCARMSGMKGPMKDEKGRPTRKAKSLKRWKC